MFDSVSCRYLNHYTLEISLIRFYYTRNEFLNIGRYISSEEDYRYCKWIEV